jgi:small-conductance mechanosensitive channel
MLVFLAVTALGVLLIGRLRRIGGDCSADKLPAVASLRRIVGYGSLALGGLVAWIVVADVPAFAGVVALAVVVALTYNPVTADLLAGLLLLLDQRIRPGDWVEFDGRQGRVCCLHARYAELRAPDGGRLAVPNRLLLGSPLRICTMAATGTPVVVHFKVSSAADPELVLSLAERVAGEVSELSPAAVPRATLDDVTTGVLEISLSVVVAESADATIAASRLRTALLKALKTAGIAPPRPERDLHLRDLDGLRQALAAAMAERRRRQASDGEN